MFSRGAVLFFIVGFVSLGVGAILYSYPMTKCPPRRRLQTIVRHAGCYDANGTQVAQIPVATSNATLESSLIAIIAGGTFLALAIMMLPFVVYFARHESPPPPHEERMATV